MNDTHPLAMRVWIDLLRKAGPERRSRLASQITQQTKWRAMAAIARARPDLSEQERKLLFVRIHYGRELAEGVRRCFDARQR